MPFFLLHHQHQPDECDVAFAAWQGFPSPPGMTISEYRSSRPRRPSLRTRLMSHLRITPPR